MFTCFIQVCELLETNAVSEPERQIMTKRSLADFYFIAGFATSYTPDVNENVSHTAVIHT